MSRAAIFGVVVGLVLVSCGEADSNDPPSAEILETSTAPPTSTTSPPSGTVASAAVDLPGCRDMSWPTAPNEWYRDTPQYLDDEMPYREVEMFAVGLPGYEKTWVDLKRNGWVTVGFVDTDVAARQAELMAEFPGEGVVAVDMVYTEPQLRRIAHQIAADLPENMQVDHLTIDSYRHIAIEVWDATPDSSAELAELVGDYPVCAWEHEPNVLLPDAPQPQGGEGWRYLGEFDRPVSGTWSRPRVVADEETLTALWAQLGSAPRPEVDFAEEIVVTFETGGNSSCPETRLDEVVVADEGVNVVFGNPSQPQLACLASLSFIRVYPVAVSRQVLPAPPFLVGQLVRDRQTTVEADLRAPESIPGHGEIRRTTPREQRRATPAPYGGEVGYPWKLILDVSCGAEWLGPANSYFWRSDEVALPPEWEEAVVDGLLDLTALIEPGDPATLTATANDRSVVYEISQVAGPTCQ